MYKHPNIFTLAEEYVFKLMSCIKSVHVKHSYQHESVDKYLFNFPCTFLDVLKARKNKMMKTYLLLDDRYYTG